MVCRISDDQLSQKVSELVETFHARRLAKLRELSLSTALQKKNPYMYRAIAGDDPRGLAELILEASITSSDETSWGNDFFEELAIFVAQQAYADDPSVYCVKAEASGTDLVIHTSPKSRIYVAVKSGKSVFNSSSRQKQADHFSQLRARLPGVDVRTVVGYAYTSKRPVTEAAVGGVQAHNYFEEFAGREFWKFISGGEDDGDDTLYLRIMNAIASGDGDLQGFRIELNKVVNDWAAELLEKFGDNEGRFNWGKLLFFNSAYDSPRYRDFQDLDWDTVYIPRDDRGVLD